MRLYERWLVYLIFCSSFIFSGELYTYKAVDAGKRYARFPVPSQLRLKVGVPVILRKNITPHLVNGLQGVVKSLSESGPVISFDHETLPLKRETFCVYAGSGGVLSTRTQFPITLSYAITAHRAQGITIRQPVVVDAANMNQPGQLAVAISRGVQKSKITVLNMDKCNMVKPHPCIKAGYKGVKCSDTMECCTKTVAHSPLQSTGKTDF